MKADKAIERLERLQSGVDLIGDDWLALQTLISIAKQEEVRREELEGEIDNFAVPHRGEKGYYIRTDIIAQALKDKFIIMRR